MSKIKTNTIENIPGDVSIPVNEIAKISDIPIIVANPTVTGTTTFTNSTNNINLTNIGNITLEIGDVITVTDSSLNNKEFTVEVITDINNIIVNQAHAGGSTTKSLNEESNTVGVTVSLLAKWHSAAKGVGQGVVDVISSRVKGVEYTNDTKREINVYVRSTAAGTQQIQMFIDGLLIRGDHAVAGFVLTIAVSIPPGSVYEITGITSAVSGWIEER